MQTYPRVGPHGNCVTCTELGAENAIYGNTYQCSDCRPLPPPSPSTQTKLKEN